MEVNADDKMGRKPIHFALYRTLEYVQMLEEGGADLFARDLMERNPLHFAVVGGRLDMVKYVLDKDKNLVNKLDVDKWTPLMWAMRVCELWGTKTDQRASIIRELLDHGADKLAEGRAERPVDRLRPRPILWP